MKTRRWRGGIPPLNLSMMRKTAIHHISFASSVAVYRPEQLAAWDGAETETNEDLGASAPMVDNVREFQKGESCRGLIMARVHSCGTPVSRQSCAVLRAAEAFMEVEREK